MLLRPDRVRRHPLGESRLLVGADIFRQPKVNPDDIVRVHGSHHNQTRPPAVAKRTGRHYVQSGTRGSRREFRRTHLQRSCRLSAAIVRAFTGVRLSGVFQNCVAELAGIPLAVVRKFEDFFNDVIDVNQLWTPTRFRDDVVQNATKFLELIGAVWAEHFEIPQANRSGPRWRLQRGGILLVPGGGSGLFGAPNERNPRPFS